MSLIERTACELTESFRSGESTAEQIVAAFCERIEAVDARVGAFLHYERGAALSQAEELDRKRAAGKPLGRLAGVPVAIKDLICGKGEPATCGSKILRNFIAPYDAHVIQRLKFEDAILIGRVNMDEFAMGSSTENSAYRQTHNPWNVDFVPGGSSGGSAAAVAALEAPLALGTDTGGSIRQPAALCGIVGLKPTYGRVSRFGLVAFASSLDQIGPMSRNVADAALLLSCIAGHDGRDSTSFHEPVPDFAAALAATKKELRIGIVAEHFAAGIDPEVEKAVRAAIDRYRDLGATIVDVELPHARYGIAAYYLVATAEASSNLARYDGIHYGHRAAKFNDLIDLYSATRGEAFGAEVKRRIMLGTFSLSAGYRDAYYLKALKARRLIKADYDAAFAKCDVILGPTTPTPAFQLGSKTADPLEMYLSDIYTVGANLAGVPGISLPCGFSGSGLPIGMQLQAAAFGEATLLSAANLYQAATDWHTRIAPS